MLAAVYRELLGDYVFREDPAIQRALTQEEWEGPPVKEFGEGQESTSFVTIVRTWTDNSPGYLTGKL